LKVIAIAAVLAAVFFLGLAVPAPTLAVSPGAGGVPSTFPTPIQHVFVIMLENAMLSTVLAQGPYLTSLYDQYAGADHYYGVCHPSASNYLALTSGRLLQCGSDAVTANAIPNLADLVTSAGESWMAYMQSMPAPCTTADSGQYVAHHDPFIYYNDIVGNRTRCDSHVVPLSQFNASSTPANLVWITPDRFHDGHTPQSVPNADAWLKSFLPPLLAEPWAASSVFFVAYDEGVYLNGTDQYTGYNGLDGGNAYLSAVTPYSVGRGLYTSNSTEYNLLATIEWLLGTGDLGQNDTSAEYPAMKELFDFARPPPIQYPVTGQVLAPNDTAIAGARVFANTSGNSSVTVTNRTGGFEFSLTNGTYALRATSPGWIPAGSNVTVAGQSPPEVTITLTQLRSTWAVAFTEVGLPPAIEWTVRVADLNLSSSNQSMVVQLSNGSYPYSVNSPTNLTASPGSGTVLVEGRNVTVPITFESPPPPRTYPVTFTPQGLAPATEWTVNLGNDSAKGLGTLDFTVPNGTYDYTITQPANYTTNATTGAVTVIGTGVAVTVPFEAVGTNGSGNGTGNSTTSTVYPVEFLEQGLSSEAPWWVAVSGGRSLNLSTSGPSILFSLTNGSYSFAVGTAAAFAPNASHGVFFVLGTGVSYQISFSPLASSPVLPPAGTLVPESAAPPVSTQSLAILALGASAIAVTVDRVFQQVQRFRNQHGPDPRITSHDTGGRGR
jgi:phosphatidylinositol-3-phosphatase